MTDDREILNERIEEERKNPSPSPERILQETIATLGQNLDEMDRAQANARTEPLPRGAAEVLKDFLNHAREGAEGEDARAAIEGIEETVGDHSSDECTLGLGRSQFEDLTVLQEELGDSFGEAYPSDLELLENARARV